MVSQVSPSHAQRLTIWEVCELPATHLKPFIQHNLGERVQEKIFTQSLLVIVGITQSFQCLELIASIYYGYNIQVI